MSAHDRRDCYSPLCQCRLYVASKIIKIGVWLSPAHYIERSETDRSEVTDS